MARNTGRRGLSHWWSLAWLDVFEEVCARYGSQRQNGPADAHAGRVWPLSVQPGKLSATTQDPYRGCFSPTIRVRQLDGAVWGRIVATLAARPELMPRLLAGELPEPIEQACGEMGVSLIPTANDLLRMGCQCLPRAPYCRHQAALLRAVADNLERDGTPLLSLRGQPLAQVVEAVRATWDSSDGTAGERPLLPAAPPPEARTEHHMLMARPPRAAGFYAAGPELNELRLAFRPPPAEAEVLRRLGQPPFAAEHEPALETLARVYGVMTKHALHTWQRGAQSSGADFAALALPAPADGDAE